MTDRRVEIRRLLDTARNLIAAERYEEARAVSDTVRGELDRHEPASLMTPDGAPRPVSVVLVAYRKAAEHKAMCQMLLGLDPDRFELIFVENADEQIFDLGQPAPHGNVRLLRVGFNAGCSPARNLAVRVAVGRAILFIDDDGATTPEAIEALLTTFEDHEAMAVRGRVAPKTPGSFIPRHYDRGPVTRPMQCNIEGFSVWRADAFHRWGGFDPILYGNEGVELTARMFPGFGPDAFLYEPRAVLEHDFAADPDKAREKKARHARLKQYCIHKNALFDDVLKQFARIRQDVVSVSLLNMRRQVVKLPALTGKSKEPVSVIATSSDAHMPDDAFLRSWNDQTDRAFELVVCADGAEGEVTAERGATLDPGIEMRVLPGVGFSRSASLNRALAEARNDICVLANIEDVPVPQRIEWTRKCHALYPDADLVGLLTHGALDTDPDHLAQSVDTSSFQARKYLGMPAPFAALSFRKSRVAARFDETLQSGCEHEWMFRALEEDGIEGRMVPLRAVYSPARSAAPGGDAQPSVLLSQIRRAHTGLIGSDDLDDRAISALAGLAPVASEKDYNQARIHALLLLRSAQDRLDREVAAQLCRDLDRMLHMLRVQQMSAADSRGKQQNQKYSDRIIALEHSLAEQAERLAQLQDEARELQQSLGQLRASRSWRLTAPIRRLAAGLGLFRP